jgi:hypothetical protein
MTRGIYCRQIALTISNSSFGYLNLSVGEIGL